MPENYYLLGVDPAASPDRTCMAIHTMYGCVVRPVGGLSASWMCIDGGPNVPLPAGNRWQRERCIAKLEEAYVNSKRALKRGDLRRARYWANAGEPWSRKLKRFA
jgi:hypothetical protein